VFGTLGRNKQTTLPSKCKRVLQKQLLNFMSWTLYDFHMSSCGKGGLGKKKTETKFGFIDDKDTTNPHLNMN
jgi:hypothetical protein